RPARCHHGTLRLRPPSGIHRRNPDYSDKRTRARIVARGRAPCDLQRAVPTPSRHDGGPNSSGGACGLCRLCRPGSMATCPRHLVKAKTRESAAKVVSSGLVDTPQSPLSEAKRTLGQSVEISALDPKRTYSHHDTIATHDPFEP